MSVKGRRTDAQRPAEEAEKDARERASPAGRAFPPMRGEPAKRGDPPIEELPGAPRSRHGGRADDER